MGELQLGRATTDLPIVPELLENLYCLARLSARCGVASRPFILSFGMSRRASARLNSLHSAEIGSEVLRKTSDIRRIASRVSAALANIAHLGLRAKRSDSVCIVADH